MPQSSTGAYTISATQSPYQVEVSPRYLDADDIVSNDGANVISNLNQLISATDNMSVINIGGGLTKGKAVGVGATFTFNEMSRNKCDHRTETVSINETTDDLGKGVDYDNDRINVGYLHGFSNNDQVYYYNDNVALSEGYIAEMHIT